MAYIPFFGSASGRSKTYQPSFQEVKKKIEDEIIKNWGSVIKGPKTTSTEASTVSWCSSDFFYEGYSW